MRRAYYRGNEQEWTAVVPKKPVVDGEKVGSLKVMPNYFPFRRSCNYSTSNKICNSKHARRYNRASIGTFTDI